MFYIRLETGVDKVVTEANITAFDRPNNLSALIFFNLKRACHYKDVLAPTGIHVATCRMHSNQHIP